jgi:hypothetical protein
VFLLPPFYCASLTLSLTESYFYLWYTAHHSYFRQQKWAMFGDYLLGAKTYQFPAFSDVHHTTFERIYVYMTVYMVYIWQCTRQYIWQCTWQYIDSVHGLYMTVYMVYIWQCTWSMYDSVHDSIFDSVHGLYIWQCTWSGVVQELLHRVLSRTL